MATSIDLPSRTRFKTSADRENDRRIQQERADALRKLTQDAEAERRVKARMATDVPVVPPKKPSAAANVPDVSPVRDSRATPEELSSTLDKIMGSTPVAPRPTPLETTANAQRRLNSLNDTLQAVRGIRQNLESSVPRGASYGLGAGATVGGRPAINSGNPLALGAQRFSSPQAALSALSGRPTVANADELATRATSLPANVTPMGSLRGSQQSNMRNREIALAALTTPKPETETKFFDQGLADAIAKSRQTGGKPVEYTDLEGNTKTATGTDTSVNSPIGRMQEQRLAETGASMPENAAAYAANIAAAKAAKTLPMDERGKRVVQRNLQRGAANEYQNGNPLALIDYLNKQQYGGGINPWAAGLLGGGGAFNNALAHNAAMAGNQADMLRAMNEGAALNDPWMQAIRGAAANETTLPSIPELIAARDRARNGTPTNGSRGMANVEDVLNPNKGEVHLKNGNMTSDAMDKLTELADSMNAQPWWRDSWMSWNTLKPKYFAAFKARYPKLTDQDLERWFEQHKQRSKLS